MSKKKQKLSKEAQELNDKLVQLFKDYKDQAETNKKFRYLSVCKYQ